MNITIVGIAYAGLALLAKREETLLPALGVRKKTMNKLLAIDGRNIYTQSCRQATDRRATA